MICLAYYYNVLSPYRSKIICPKIPLTISVPSLVTIFRQQNHTKWSQHLQHQITNDLTNHESYICKCHYNHEHRPHMLHRTRTHINVVTPDGSYSVANSSRRIFTALLIHCGRPTILLCRVCAKLNTNIEQSQKAATHFPAVLPTSGPFHDIL